MDIYVRKSEKPESCRDCPFFNCCDDCSVLGEGSGEQFGSYEEMHDCCPLNEFEYAAEMWVELKKRREGTE